MKTPIRAVAVVLALGGMTGLALGGATLALGTASAYASAPSAIGTWNVSVDWTKGAFAGSSGSFRITFASGGTFTDSTGEYGNWKQKGASLSFAYNKAINDGCNASYTGKWIAKKQDWTGRMKSNCSSPDSTGVWSMSGLGASPAHSGTSGSGNPNG